MSTVYMFTATLARDLLNGVLVHDALRQGMPGRRAPITLVLTGWLVGNRHLDQPGLKSGP